MLPPSARPEGQLTLSRWPSSFYPLPRPSTHTHPYFTPNALQRLLASPHSLSQSALEEFPSITHCTLSLCWSGISLCCPWVLDDFFFFSGPDIGLVSFRLCICSLVHTVLDLNQPPPSLSVIHRSCILCTKNENYYWELFCLYGGGPFFFLFFFRKNEPTLAQLRFGESRLKI